MTVEVPVENSIYRQIMELARLAAAQIQVAMGDADESVESLTAAFTDIVEQDRSIRSLASQLPDDEELQPLKQAITEQSSALSNNVRTAIIAFQFFDRLTQRLDHTTYCLKELSAVGNSDSEQTASIDTIRNAIYSSYTMEEERQLYQELMDNHDFEQALENFRAKKLEAGDDDEDIEFF